MKQKYKSILILVTLIMLLILYINNSLYIINNILEYSTLFITKLFPASFLFFILSSLLLDYGIIELLEKITNKNSSSLYLLLISMISGFPSGAKYTKELYNKKYITLDEANSYLLFSHFPNPLFIMGTVCSILQDKVISYEILLSIILSNLIIYIIINRRNSNKHKIVIDRSINNSFSNSLVQSITNSFSTLIIIYGTSLFFYLIACIITKYFKLSSFNYVLINGIFDLTKGTVSTNIINNTIIQAYFILFFISFGGISIHMQVKSILIDSPIKYKYFLLGRIIGILLVIIIFSILIIPG